MQDATPTNPIAPPAPGSVAGHNAPPEHPHDAIKTQASELNATLSAWLNEVPTIEDQTTADTAADYLRQVRDCKSLAEKARKETKQPHLDARREVDEDWAGVKAPLDRAITLIGEKLVPWAQKIEAEKQAALEAARKAEEEARQRAEAEAENAAALYQQAERGELAGTGTNTAAALEHAETAERDALHAEQQRQRMECDKGVKPGGSATIGGKRRSVGLRTIRAGRTGSPRHQTRPISAARRPPSTRPQSIV